MHLTVLIIEDHPEDVELIVRELRRSGVQLTSDCVDSERAYLDRLERPPLPDVILADFTLPHFSALRALELLQERKLDIPFFIVTGTVSEESAVGCIKLGASDCFLKDRLARLAPAISHALDEKRLRDEKRQAEESLRQSEERYRNLVEHAPDAVFVTHDNQIVYGNDAAVRLLGAAGRKDFIGRDFLDFIHPDYQANVRLRIERILADNRPSPLAEEQIVRLDGEAVDVEVIGMPCIYDGLPAIQRVLRDVSDRRRAQEKARQHLAELAHVTRLRMMGELMSEVSHEINQPLYAISNFAEASLNRLRSPQAAAAGHEILGWLEQIAVQANRAGEIIRRIGRFVRKSPAKLVAADVNEIVRDVVELLSVDGRLDVVDLQLELADNAPLVNVDRIQIEQVLVNLLRNALEAMSNNPSADRQLRVRTEWLPTTAVRVVVRDNGRGLPPEDLKRLFEPFFTTKSEGMGMGLSISHSIIEAHGGRMEALANSDRGLTFQFTLPIARKGTTDGE
jgi:PAS domain S-box-containing protein